VRSIAILMRYDRALCPKGLRQFDMLLAQRGKKLALALACYLAAAGRLSAQQPNPPPANVPPGGTLKILILEGQNAVNNVRAPMPVQLAVNVLDQSDRPIEGATVIFQLPVMGPGGSFEGGVRSKQFITNSVGEASGSYTPNTERGRFTIQVTAILGPRTGMASITQRNSTATEIAQKAGWFSRHKKLLILTAVATGGTVVAAILATRSSSPPPPPTVTIAPGVPSVGGP
jgi:hypothetical protein